MQIGMDTPQVTAADLTAVADGLGRHEAVLGDAADGGWWVLGLRRPDAAAALRGVPMSTPTTGADTRAALEAAGLAVGTTTELTRRRHRRGRRRGRRPGAARPVRRGLAGEDPMTEATPLALHRWDRPVDASDRGGARALPRPDHRHRLRAGPA